MTTLNLSREFRIRKARKIGLARNGVLTGFIAIFSLKYSFGLARHAKKAHIYAQGISLIMKGWKWKDLTLSSSVPELLAYLLQGH
jgi:hypothetical protein